VTDAACAARAPNITPNAFRTFPKAAAVNPADDSCIQPIGPVITNKRGQVRREFSASRHDE
jgi:hypothetical protein